MLVNNKIITIVLAHFSNQQQFRKRSEAYWTVNNIRNNLI